MNFVTMIGKIDNINKQKWNSIITLRVEKPFMDSQNENDFFDNIDIFLNNQIFQQDLKKMEKGFLIGFKGRIKNENNNLKIIAEKIQIF